MYKPTPVELQSNLTRVEHAELLIEQLPDNHDGRNTWLLNYGTMDEAQSLREVRGIVWVPDTEAAETTGGNLPTPSGDTHAP